MKQTDSLFALIKTMSKAEKRFFKLSCNSYRTKNSKDYLRLFDAIDKQETYDEVAIREKFKTEAYFRHLPVIKIYLRKQIIKSLRNFNEESSVSTKIANYLVEAELLFKRQLLNDCSDAIKRAKVLAVKFEKLPLLLELMEWESRIAVSLNLPKKLQELHNTQHVELNNILAELEEINSLAHIKRELQIILISKMSAKTQVEQNFIKSILADKILAGEASTFSGELTRLTILIMCYDLMNKESEKHQLTEKVILLYEMHPHQIDEAINLYFAFVLYCIDIAFSMKHYIECKKLIEKLKNLSGKKGNELRVWNKMRLLQMDIFMLIEQGEFEKAVRMVPEMIRLQNSVGNKSSQLEEMYFNLIYASIYMRCSDYEKAHFYVHQIINSSSEIGQAYHIMARVANVAIQFELKEFRYLAYALHSAYRYLSKIGNLQPPYNIFLSYFKSAILLNTEKEAVELLKELRNSLLPYRHNEFIIDFFIIEWIDSKLQNRELAEIVKENYLTAIAMEEV